ncbi:MAG: hypothetical protein ACHQ0J_13860 [Candidatus Dormibacterales bacterium]
MPDMAARLALLAGLLCGLAVLAASGWRLPAGSVRWVVKRWRNALGLVVEAGWRRRLSSQLERSGWNLGANQAALVALSSAGCLAVVGFMMGPAWGPVGFATAIAAWTISLLSSVERKRRRLAGELVPLLELFMLELSAGGSALAALGSVCLQVEGELASDLRRMLIASQVAGSATFEARLIQYAENVQISALASLATVLAASREFGTGTGQGVRALATDLRRAQRRELIARSRKALNHVLLPAAFGVLLPFLGILMFPAVSVLQRSLH